MRIVRADTLSAADRVRTALNIAAPVIGVATARKAMREIGGAEKLAGIPIDKYGPLIAELAARTWPSLQVGLLGGRK